MKSKNKKFLYVVGAIFLVIMLLLSSLFLSPVQLFFVHRFSSWFTSKTGAELYVGEIALSPLGSLRLNQLLLRDGRSDTLLFVDSLYADFSPTQLYRSGRLTLDSVSLSRLYVNLYKASPDSFYNYHFLSEAFPSDTTSPKTPSKFDLTIQAASLWESRFSHQIRADGYEAANYCVSAINAHLKVGSINLQNFDAQMYRLSAKDSSGLAIDSLSFRFSSTADSVLMVDAFYLALPQSFLSIPSAFYALKTGRYGGEIEEADILLPELSRYITHFTNYTSPLHFSAKLSGDVPAMMVEDFTCSYGNFCHLTLPRISSSDLSDWQLAEYQIENSSILLHSSFSQLLTDWGVSLPSSFALFPSSIALSATGGAKELILAMKCSTPDGNCSVESTSSHSFSDRKSHFHLLLSFDSLRWQQWASLFDRHPADGQCDLSGEWRWNRLPTAQLHAQIEQIAFKNYLYSPVVIDLSIKEKEALMLHLAMDDSALTANFSAEMLSWMSDSLHLSMEGELNHFAPRSLHWLNDTTDWQMDAEIVMNGKGSDWRRWNGEILIDSLLLKRDEKIFFAEQIAMEQRPMHSGQQALRLTSPFLKASLYGNYDFTQLYEQLLWTAQRSLPVLQHNPLPTAELTNQFQADFQLYQIDSLASLFGWDCSLSDTLQMRLGLAYDSSFLALSIPSFRWEDKVVEVPDFSLNQQSDSLSLKADFHYHLMGEDTSALEGNFRLAASKNHIFGNLILIARPDSQQLYLPLRTKIALMKDNNDEIAASMELDSTSFYLNSQPMRFSNSLLQWSANRLQLSNFSLHRGLQNLVSIEGTISASLQDTLRLSFRQLELKNLLSIWLPDELHFDALLNGDIYASAILGKELRFYTDNFVADSVSYNSFYWGNLTLNALWDNLNRGVSTQLVLQNADREIMKMGGIYHPPTRELALDALLDSIPLKLFTPFLSDYLFAINGLGEANLQVRGALPDLSLRGKIFFRDANVGIRYTGTSYFLPDTLLLEGDKLKLSNFRIFDEKGKNLLLNGEIKHQSFRQFNYKLTLNMNDFLLFDNARSPHNLLSGHFYANATNIRLIGDEEGAVLTGEFSNSNQSTLYINLPEMPVEATTYRSIVYVEPAGDTLLAAPPSVRDKSFDWTVDMMVNLSDKSTFYVSLFDGAMIRGNGRIRLLYDDSKLSLYNRFQAEDGYVKMKLSGLPSKNFMIKQGSFVEFIGDPMKLRFDATAVYQLSADLSTLSPSFSSMGLSTTRVPVWCELNAAGNLDKMNLSYEVKLPDSSDEIVENMNSIINSDAIKIKEFAYLLGVGMFYDPSGRARGDAFSSLASSSISSALNNSLANVLGNKVQLGAGFSSSKEDFSDLEMNVTVSTKFFKDRLLLKSSLGYQSQSADNGETSFLGNFDAEYLLTKSGMFRIKIYNHTNNDFYRTANNTQGIGFLFVKEAKRLRDLFRFRSSKPSIDVVKSDSTAAPSRPPLSSNQP